MPTGGRVVLCVESDEAFFAQGTMRGFAAADDDVIQYADADDLAGFDQLACNAKILGGWGRVAGRMVVRENDRFGTIADRVTEYFTRMHGGGTYEAKCDQVAGDEFVFRVQAENRECLLGKLRHVGANGVGAFRIAQHSCGGFANLQHVYGQGHHGTFLPAYHARGRAWC